MCTHSIVYHHSFSSSLRLFFFPRDSRFSFSYSRRRLLAEDCFFRGFLSEEGGLFRFRALMPWKTPLRYLSGFSSFLGFLKLPQRRALPSLSQQLAPPSSESTFRCYLRRVEGRGDSPDSSNTEDSEKLSRLLSVEHPWNSPLMVEDGMACPSSSSPPGVIWTSLPAKWHSLPSPIKYRSFSSIFTFVLASSSSSLSTFPSASAWARAVCSWSSCARRAEFSCLARWVSSAELSFSWMRALQASFSERYYYFRQLIEDRIYWEGSGLRLAWVRLVESTYWLFLRRVESERWGESGLGSLGWWKQRKCSWEGARRVRREGLRCLEKRSTFPEDCGDSRACIVGICYYQNQQTVQPLPLL